MHRILPVTAATLAALLAVPATAPAKEVGRVLACGADGCTNVTDRVPGGPDGGGIFATGALGNGQPARHRFVVVRVAMRDPSNRLVDSWKFLFVPALDMVRYQPEPGVFHWGQLAPTEGAAMHRLVRGVKPWPAARMPVDDTPEPTSPATVLRPAPEATATTDDSAGPPLSAAVAAGAAAAMAAAGVAAARRRRRAPWR